MTIEQLKEMRERVKNLYTFLQVGEKKNKIESDRQLSLSPGFWDNNERATGILKEIKTNSYWTGLYDKTNSAVEDFAVLFDFWYNGKRVDWRKYPLNHF